MKNYRLLAVLMCVAVPTLTSVLGQATSSPDGHTETANTATNFGATTVPRLVRFAGVAHDFSGKPLAGIIGVTFALYTEPTGGVALWLETQNVQADTNGHYSVLLGSTKADGLPAEIFASGQARWVGVQIEQQVEQQRTLLC
jgi:hypothetical protein